MSDKNPGKTGYLGNPDHQQFATDNLDEFSDGIVPWVVQFRVVGTPDFIKVDMRENLLIGRKDTGSKNFPDIDIAPYNALKNGVSRRHAILTAKDNRVTICDLGSSNGTYINQKRLKPDQPYRLRDGDLLHLGKLELQVHFILKPIRDEDTIAGAGNALGIPVIGQGQTVLILDNDENVCKVLKRFVGFANFNVKLAHTTAEAIAIIDNDMPNMLIVELTLPEDTTGVDIISYLRNKSTPHYIPIMAISEATGGYMMNQALQQGADMFLGKPVSLEELIEGLRSMVTWMSKPQK